MWLHDIPDYMLVIYCMCRDLAQRPVAQLNGSVYKEEGGKGEGATIRILLWRKYNFRGGEIKMESDAILDTASPVNVSNKSLADS